MIDWLLIGALACWTALAVALGWYVRARVERYSDDIDEIDWEGGAS